MDEIPPVSVRCMTSKGSWCGLRKRNLAYRYCPARRHVSPIPLLRTESITLYVRTEIRRGISASPTSVLRMAAERVSMLDIQPESPTNQFRLRRFRLVKELIAQQLQRKQT